MQDHKLGTQEIGRVDRGRANYATRGCEFEGGVRVGPMTIGVVSFEAIATIVVAAVGAGIDMIGAELLFAVAAKLAGRDTAHGTGRQGDCVRGRVDKRCADECARHVCGRMAGG